MISPIAALITSNTFNFFSPAFQPAFRISRKHLPFSMKMKSLGCRFELPACFSNADTLITLRHSTPKPIYNSKRGCVSLPKLANIFTPENFNKKKPNSCFPFSSKNASQENYFMMTED
jgi:hypothetical protein